MHELSLMVSLLMDLILTKILHVNIYDQVFLLNSMKLKDNYYYECFLFIIINLQIYKNLEKFNKTI